MLSTLRYPEKPFAEILTICKMKILFSESTVERFLPLNFQDLLHKTSGYAKQILMPLEKKQLI